jgi:hypothetical protein
LITVPPSALLFSANNAVVTFSGIIDIMWSDVAYDTGSHVIDYQIR